MQRFILTIMLCLLASAAWASGTFEVQDPAAEIYEEQNAPEPELPATPDSPPEPQAAGGMNCTVDTDSGECFCIGKASAKKLPLGQEDCAAQIHQALDKRASFSKPQ